MLVMSEHTASDLNDGLRMIGQAPQDALIPCLHPDYKGAMAICTLKGTGTACFGIAWRSRG